MMERGGEDGVKSENKSHTHEQKKEGRKSVMV